MSEKTDKSSKKGRLRWLKQLVVLLLVLCGSLVGTYWWSERVALAEEQIRTALMAAGLEDFDLALLDVGLGGVRVKSFVVGDSSRPLLRVENIRAGYTLSGLLERRLQSIEVGAISLSLKGDETGLDLGPLLPLMGGGGDGAGFQTGPIFVKSFSASLDLPQGSVHVSGSGAVEQVGSSYRIAPTDGCVNVDVGTLRLGGVLLDPFSTQACATSVDGDVYWPPTSGISFRTSAVPLIVRNDLGGPLLQIQLTELRAKASLREKITLQLRTEGADFLLPPQDLSLSNADIEISFDDLVSLAGQWRLTSGGLSDLADVRRFAPLGIVGDGRVAAASTSFDLLVSDAATYSLLASVEGTHSAVSGRGTAQVVAGPLIYSPAGLQPQALLPTLKGLLTNVVGSMSATAHIQWGPGDVRGTADARLDDLGFSTEAARVEGVAGNLAFDDLFPPRTAEGQRLDVGSVDAGMVLTDGAVTFSLDGMGGVIVESASWPFAGGAITLSSGVIEPGASEQSFELAVDKVDLAAFINLLALDGASGTGVISGRIPVTIRDGDPIIAEGVLTASEPGQLSYKGGGSDAVGGGQGALVFQALEDFQYTGLTLSLEGNAQDRLTLKLNLEGANPGLYDGYPFAININTEASFAELLRSATLGTNAIDLIRGKGVTDQ
ncbi:YdbH domain-containing protein [Parvibaculaceae bacterium PLY_AMNH_Bact1]|nr:YdbH domain-containing protein [Parvibaculaceae bacterium PLY_AMNH_Bact1]